MCVCKIFVFALLQETKRPSKEMQVSIARQLSLQPTTVGNFFMNARRRLQDKWKEGDHESGSYSDDATGPSEAEVETSQSDEYSDKTPIVLNQGLLVPELLHQNLTLTSQQSHNHQEYVDMPSINEQHGNSSILSEPQTSICNIISVPPQVTDINSSPIDDQIVPINTHHEQQMPKNSLDIIGSVNTNCSNVPEPTTIDERVNALNPNPHQSVYSLTSL